MEKMWNPGGGCGCCGGMMPGMGMGKGFGMGHDMGKRKFFTKMEKIEWMEREIKETEMELAGMKEKLADLRK